MKRHIGQICITALLLVGLACLATPAAAAQGDLKMAPPGNPYQPVHELVPLPDFVPGLGTLYVDPATLPAGPFLAYNRRGELVSSVYMIPMADLSERKAFPELAAGKKPVDHVSLNWVAGHPGVTDPHYHIVVWYISPDEAAALK